MWKRHNIWLALELVEKCQNLVETAQDSLVFNKLSICCGDFLPFDRLAFGGWFIRIYGFGRQTFDLFWSKMISDRQTGEAATMRQSHELERRNIRLMKSIMIAGMCVNVAKNSSRVSNPAVWAREHCLSLCASSLSPHIASQTAAKQKQRWQPFGAHTESDCINLEYEYFNQNNTKMWTKQSHHWSCSIDRGKEIRLAWFARSVLSILFCVRFVFCLQRNGSSKFHMWAHWKSQTTTTAHPKRFGFREMLFHSVRLWLCLRRISDWKSKCQIFSRKCAVVRFSGENSNKLAFVVFEFGEKWSTRRHQFKANRCLLLYFFGVRRLRHLLDCDPDESTVCAIKINVIIGPILLFYTRKTQRDEIVRTCDSIVRLRVWIFLDEMMKLGNHINCCVGIFGRSTFSIQLLRFNYPKMGPTHGRISSANKNRVSLTQSGQSKDIFQDVAAGASKYVCQITALR